jgi:hypothetical protein
MARQERIDVRRGLLPTIQVADESSRYLWMTRIGSAVFSVVNSTRSKYGATPPIDLALLLDQVPFGEQDQSKSIPKSLQVGLTPERTRCSCG